MHVIGTKKIILNRNPADNEGDVDNLPKAKTQACYKEVEETIQSPASLMKLIHHWLDKASSLRNVESRLDINALVGDVDIMVSG
jgi:hypothetical protein